jgi:ATP-dependent exoDNAse (exonuclease V) beta subunit
VRFIDAASLDAIVVPAKTTHSTAPKDWGMIAEREYSALRALVEKTPSASKLRMAGENAEAEAEEASPEAHVMETAQKRSVRLGTAFHEAMERADIFHLKSSELLLRELGAHYGLDSESADNLREMMELCISSELMERARSASRSGRKILREIPYVRSMNDSAIEEGKIDLLFEEADGWVVVDYKTDWVSREKEGRDAFFREKYSSQVREYVEALKCLSLQVNSAYLLLARTGDAVKIL